MRQYGFVSREQASNCGHSDKMIWARVKDGRWIRLHAGVYRIASVPPSWRADLVAASFGCGGVVSHRAAGALWRMDGIDDGAVELTVAGTGERSLRGVVVHRTRLLPVADRTAHAACP